MKKRKRWIYAMYKGDDIIAIGTSDEICKQLGINKMSFHRYRTKYYKKLLENSKNRRYVVKLDDCEYVEVK